MRPDNSNLNTDPHYLRDLIDQTGLSQSAAARKIGVSERSMRHYLAFDQKHPAPYVVQFALECLARED